MIEEKREKVGHGQPTSLFHLVKLQLTILAESNGLSQLTDVNFSS